MKTIFKIVQNYQDFSEYTDFKNSDDISYHSTKENAENKVETLIKEDVEEYESTKINWAKEAMQDYEEILNNLKNNIIEITIWDIISKKSLVNKYPLYEIVEIKLED